MLRHPLFSPLTTTRSRLFSNWRRSRLPAIDGLIATSVAAILLLWIAFHPCPSYAGMDSEIDHLLHYIQTSGCTFNRNGNIHDSQDASDHIRKKYAHTKLWIKSAEDFIRYAATESSMSGRPYQVRCDGIEMPTAEWLADELARYREKTQ